MRGIAAPSGATSPSRFEKLFPKIPKGIGLALYGGEV